MSEKCCPFFYSYSPKKYGQDFFAMQYDIYKQYYSYLYYSKLKISVFLNVCCHCTYVLEVLTNFM